MKANFSYLWNHRGFRQAPATTVLQLLVWKLRCLLGVPATIELISGGPRLHLPPEWRGVAKIVYIFRENYEAELKYMAHVLCSGMVVVDVGASYGVYAMTAAGLVGASGRVLAFEPAARSFSVLERNVRLNRLDNVLTFRLALSDSAAKARLYHHPDSSRNSLGAGDGSPGTFEEVSTATLDSMLEKEGVSRVDFIKVDVEGAEELVLRGATSILRRAKPVVLIEANPEAAETLGLSRRGAWDLLEGFGYEFFTVSDYCELHARCSPPDGGNVVAICRDRQ